jgi:hypothetical protein
MTSAHDDLIVCSRANTTPTAPTLSTNIVAMTNRGRGRGGRSTAAGRGAATGRAGRGRSAGGRGGGRTGRGGRTSSSLGRGQGRGTGTGRGAVARSASSYSARGRGSGAGAHGRSARGRGAHRDAADRRNYDPCSRGNFRVEIPDLSRWASEDSVVPPASKIPKQFVSSEDYLKVIGLLCLP